MLAGADRAEAITGGRAGEQAEREQQSERPEARHHEVDVTGLRIVAHAVVGHDERPGSERHELPGQQEGEGIVRQHHQVYRAEECRIERQDA